MVTKIEVFEEYSNGEPLMPGKIRVGVLIYSGDAVVVATRNHSFSLSIPSFRGVMIRKTNGRRCTHSVWIPRIGPVEDRCNMGERLFDR